MRTRSSGSHRRVRPSRPPGGQQAPAVSVDHLLEALPDGVAFVDKDGRIVYTNSILQKLSGYRSAELVGQLVELLVPERLHAYHTARRAEYVGNPYARSMGVNPYIVVRRKDGTEFPVDIALSPLQTASGEVVVATLRDASERRNEEGRRRLMRLMVDAVE